MAHVLEKQYGEQFEMQNLGSLDDLHQKMISARQEVPDEPWKWLGMHYNYFTINGSTLLGDDTNNQRYPDLKLESLTSFCSKYSLKELPKLFN
jgi:hypothetical protein